MDPFKYYKQASFYSPSKMTFNNFKVVTTYVSYNLSITVL